MRQEGEVLYYGKAFLRHIIIGNQMKNALSAIQMLHQVLDAYYGSNIIINREDMANYHTPWKNRPFKDVKNELEFAEPYCKIFLESVRQFSNEELNRIEIIHPGNGTRKILGAYLLRIGYHASVHAGQFLSYLRGMGIERPFIGD